MTIDNISIAQYLELEDTSEYDIFIEAMTPVNKFCKNPCNTNNLTYNEIEVMKKILSAPTFSTLKELFILIYRIKGDIDTSPDQLFYNEKILTFFAAKNYIQEFMMKLIKKEQEWLHIEPSEKHQMVNAQERIAPFSFLISKMGIAEKYGVKPKEVGNWKYTEVFSILVATKVKEDLNYEINNIT